MTRIRGGRARRAEASHAAHRRRVAIVGAGQLGRMLALAGYPLGLSFRFLDPSIDAPGGQVGALVRGAFTDRELMRELARTSDVLTFDWENVAVETLRTVAKRVHVAPPIRALGISQDRLFEKQLFAKLGIPTTRWAAVDSRPELDRAMRRVGLPGVLKGRRLGYDGKGQVVLRAAADADRAFAELSGQPLIYEEFIPFQREVSIIGARRRSGEVVVYPLNENIHTEGILRLTRAPAGPPAVARRAAAYLRRVLEHFDYEGILNIEFFVTNGRLVANETAPRVHNSGHWTIEGAETSQFENHLRAILDLPLGTPHARGHAAMINLVGTLPDAVAALALPGVHLHDYGKSPRPGRKLGHLTLVQPTPSRRDAAVRRVLRALGLRIPFLPVRLA